MDTDIVFESDFNSESNCSYIQVIEDDVGANVILSTASSPPRSTTSQASRAPVKVRGAASKPVVIQEICMEDIKEEILSEPVYSDATDFLDEENVKTVLISDLQGASVEDVVQYELLFPGGPIEEVKQEPSEEHDYVEIPKVTEYFCGVCGKSYSSEKSVRMHMTRTHSAQYSSPEKDKKKHSTPVKKVVCEWCGRKYASNAALRYHQRIHTGEKPYKCSECPKAFTMPLFLQIHLRTHTGERPYACATCPKAFGSLAALLRHNRVHTGVKPYTCERCGKSFTQSNSMKLHIRTVHLKEPTPYMSKERRLRQLKRQQAQEPTPYMSKGRRLKQLKRQQAQMGTTADVDDHDDTEIQTQTVKYSQSDDSDDSETQTPQYPQRLSCVIEHAPVDGNFFIACHKS